MKRILITGKNSYIGSSLAKWLSQYPSRYSIAAISLRNESWKEKDFSKYDVVFHVAGIAHIRETKENAANYYKVNCDLAYETAQKAKKEGVKQFIFLSSMSVYGQVSGVINRNTSLKPNSNYGKSKLKAEKLIELLDDIDFRVAIIRPPMIYGEGCKGNYQKLAKLAKNVPFFPSVENKRSMIYIYNFCEFVRLLIDGVSKGFYFPQNKEYVCTSNMVTTIAKAHSNNVKMMKLINPLIGILRFGAFNKIFGDLVYDMKISCHEVSYCLYDFESSIFRTEKGGEYEER